MLINVNTSNIRVTFARCNRKVRVAITHIELIELEKCAKKELFRFK